MVTKLEALRRLVDRIQDDNQRLAYNPKNDVTGLPAGCAYNHKVNGGCAIGCLLPEDVAEKLPQSVGVSFSRVLNAMMDAGFENPTSQFWAWLQEAHDKRTNDVEGSNAALLKAVLYCDSESPVME